MIAVRHTAERGAVNLGWLDTRHTFSFGDYHDPDHMGFGKLRVINEDWIEPGQGFGMHGHKDMEIITYIIDGALEHKDSMGTGSVINSGDVQRMTAGTGVRHSEFNHSQDDKVHLLQIWILPEREGLEPGYEQKSFKEKDKRNQLRLIASRDGRNGSLSVHQDVDLYATILEKGASLSHHLDSGHRGWMQVVHGTVSVNGEHLYAGDGAAIEETPDVEIKASRDAELLLFDMT